MYIRHTYDTLSGDVQRKGLPRSVVFKVESERFSRPLLDSAGRFGKVLLAPAEVAAALIPNAARQAERAREMEICMERCSSGALGYPRLKDQVIHMDVTQSPVSCAAFQPLSPYLVSANTRGFIGVANYRQQQTVNSFHVSTGEPFLPGAKSPIVSVTSMSMINDLQDPLLLVRVPPISVRSTNPIIHNLT